jgi:hypothetical protein
MSCALALATEPSLREIVFLPRYREGATEGGEGIVRARLPDSGDDGWRQNGQFPGRGLSIRHVVPFVRNYVARKLAEREKVGLRSLNESQELQPAPPYHG